MIPLLLMSPLASLVLIFILVRTDILEGNKDGIFTVWMLLTAFLIGLGMILFRL